jgi:hypothetical protein
MSESTGRPFNENELLNQIGRGVVAAISGGRFGQSTITKLLEVIDLPCGAGYRVSIELGWNDEWVVTRQFVRKGVIFKKEQSKAYFAKTSEKLRIKHLVSVPTILER